MEIEAKPPYVTFEVRAVEDRGATEVNGHWTGRDVIFAIITPAGSRDRIEKIAEDWIRDTREQVRQERFPAMWLEQYIKQYEAFKANEELVPDGFPLKEWPVIKPTQVQMLLSLNVHTVEQLAELTEEGLERIGIGAHDLRSKAQKYLEISKNDGATAKKVSNLEQENVGLKSQVEELMERLKKAESTINTLSKKSEKEEA